MVFCHFVCATGQHVHRTVIDVCSLRATLFPVPRLLSGSILAGGWLGTAEPQISAAAAVEYCPGG
jgi:hypothetical protein